MLLFFFFLNILCYLLTFVESSSNFVCSAMNRTQKQLRWISGGHFECEKAGLLIIGLLMPPEALSISGIFDKSSDSDCGIGMEPWIWQLPNGPDLLKLLIYRRVVACTAIIISAIVFGCHFTQTATSPSPFADFFPIIIIVLVLAVEVCAAGEENKEREKWLIYDLEMCQIGSTTIININTALFLYSFFLLVRNMQERNGKYTPVEMKEKQIVEREMNTK